MSALSELHRACWSVRLCPRKVRRRLRPRGSSPGRRALLRAFRARSRSQAACFVSSKRSSLSGRRVLLAEARRFTRSLHLPRSSSTAANGRALPPQVHDWRTCESPRIPTRTSSRRVSRTASKAHSVPRPGPPRSPALTTLFSRNRLSRPGRHSAPRSKTARPCRSTSRKTTSRRYRTTSSAYRSALPILRTSRPSLVSSDNTLPSCAS